MIEYVPDRLGHDWRYSVEVAKLRELGWSPAQSFEDGLATTIAWYRDHEHWWRPLKQERPVSQLGLDGPGR